MKPRFYGILVAVIVAVAIGAHWLGRTEANVRSSEQAAPTRSPLAASNSDRKILYYRDPMGKPEHSPTPKKDSMGMDFIPVYEDEQTASAPTPPAEEKTDRGRIK